MSDKMGDKMSDKMRDKKHGKIFFTMPARLNPTLLKQTLACALGALALLTAPIVQAADRAVGSLRFIGEQRIASGLMYRDTAVGGLSGLDYDAASDTWYLVTDDRSEKAPARFYTARLHLDADAFHGITLTGVSLFTQQDGKPYPSRLRQVFARGEIADFESIRIDPTDRTFWYTSEGDCITTHRDPSITHGSAAGAFISRIEPPAMLRLCHPIGSGSRFNATFEGLTFSADGRTLWVSMEGPTHEDGPLPTVESGAFGRVTEFSRDGAVLRQVAYPIDAVVPVPAQGKHGENGVSDMLAVDEHRFLMIERGAAQDENGRWSNDIRLYEMDIRDATDVKDMPALREGTFKPATKRLVLNLEALSLQRLDNIEGIAWGPKLPNGHDTLVLVSDDNFHPPQVTQLLAFEVLPPVN
ncbi:esterase-like activity of phytase family protein [Cupriavidus plantarum]|uniref:esterase-like activity of phytase family protein n=1 Tax=Cupriavidus plantarum TaxID=942865 RepID=UPI001B1B73AA|nr:esterase-like activity of phytase family protein [Cupriavidus plantarum]CAG2133922.1 hypothetical protein LMG26296_01914 [Cupriavidus plantarum]SMR84300.1 Uncharacterized conserved protein [Cupriavidus plantarum]